MLLVSFGYVRNRREFPVKGKDPKGLEILTKSMFSWSQKNGIKNQHQNAAKKYALLLQKMTRSKLEQNPNKTARTQTTFLSIFLIILIIPFKMFTALR
ncbi:hypothetical protein HYN49_11430 [Flavobacterium pallidum]|uniref:Uncharacterized protein n=1 Tax=Flavobacterium pallidum TaxID=2172098 RepID=A0A2S1SJA6_9FLAO|nr:hypothetical protein HYN49_11430 [Flavobacterium pallidum]